MTLSKTAPDKKPTRKVGTRAQPSKPESLRRTENPLYKQVVNALEDRIQRGNLMPGDMLPSEKALMDEFGVSRVTVRQALLQLAQKGMISARQGKGTYVTASPVQQQFKNEARTIVESLRAAGIEPDVNMLGLAHIAPPSYVREILNVGDQQVVRLARAYSANSVPIAVAYLFLPLAMSGVAYILEEPQNVKETSYSIFEERMGIAIGMAKHIIKTVSIDEETAGVLGLKPGDVCLCMDRITYSEQGAVLEILTLIYPPGRVGFEINLPRHEGSIVTRQLSSNQELSGLNYLE